MVRFAYVATPFTAFTGPLPDSVAPPALPRAREIAPVKLCTVFPDASRAVHASPTRRSSDLRLWPVVAAVTVRSPVGGGAAVMLNALLVAGVSVPEVVLSV